MKSIIATIFLFSGALGVANLYDPEPPPKAFQGCNCPPDCQCQYRASHPLKPNEPTEDHWRGLREGIKNGTIDPENLSNFDVFALYSGFESAVQPYWAEDTNPAMRNAVEAWLRDEAAKLSLAVTQAKNVSPKPVQKFKTVMKKVCDPVTKTCELVPVRVPVESVGKPSGKTSVLTQKTEITNTYPFVERTKTTYYKTVNGVRYRCDGGQCSPVRTRSSWRWKR